jgi:mannan endo-1,4-beta-mannosidase
MTMTHGDTPAAVKAAPAVDVQAASTSPTIANPAPAVPTLPAAPVPWTEPHPEIPYLLKPPLRPADWLVEHEPVTPGASPEARALLHFLYAISGKHTLTGQHNFPGAQGASTERTLQRTGKLPALYGTDWGFAAAGDKDTAYERREVVRQLIKQWHAGCVITLCWHAVPPTEDEPVTFLHSVQSRIADAQFADLLTPGTPLHKHWCVQVDMVAEYLKQLQDARVPILWRPFHEINGDWFWWNGVRGRDDAHGTKQLYRNIYDRLVTFHGLDNLLWVWNPDRPARADRQFVDYYPGTEYVDVLALDCYASFEQSYYDDLNALSDGKPMAIGECGKLPPLEIYTTQPKWAFYMQWAYVDRSLHEHPTPAMPVDSSLAAIVSDPRLLSLTDAGYRAAMNDVRAACGLPPLPGA